jgi:nucleoside-diphosphate-sugar epimerase
VSTERSPARPELAALPRNPEAALARLRARGLRGAAVRLAPTVHGHGDHGFVPRLIALAREKGVSPYLGDGANRWPAVHRLDAARLFRLALEQGADAGPFHAVAEQGVALRRIAELIGQRLGVPTRSMAPEDAPAHFGWMAPFVGLDCPSSSEHTRTVLGWQPTQPELLADLDHPAYFAA